MFKPFRARLVIALVTLGFTAAACSSGGASPSASTAASQAPASTAASGSAAAQATLPPPDVTTLKIGLSVTETSQFAYQLAEMEKIYEKYGITVQTSVFEGDAKALQALVAGQLDAAGLGVSSDISSQLTDVPTVAVAVNAVVLTDELVCQSSIKTKADVKGATIAISTFGGTSNGSALLSLKALGYTTNDAVIKQIGGESSRVAALEGGSVDCAVVDRSREATMKSEGFNILVDLTKQPIQWGRSALSFRKDWAQAHPDTVLNVVAAALEAQNMMWSDPQTAAKDYASFVQQDMSFATQQIQDFQNVGNRTMMWNEDAFANPQQVLETVNPDVKNVDVTTAYDMSYLQQLKDMGFYDKLGIPTS